MPEHQLIRRISRALDLLDRRELDVLTAAWMERVPRDAGDVSALLPIYKHITSMPTDETLSVDRIVRQLSLERTPTDGGVASGTRLPFVLS